MAGQNKRQKLLQKCLDILKQTVQYDLFSQGRLKFTSLITEPFVLANILLLVINNAAEMTDGFVFLRCLSQPKLFI